MKLRRRRGFGGSTKQERERATYAMRKLLMTPVPARIKATRTSLSARASRMNLSYFSYRTGTRRRKRASRMLVTEMKMANPVSPAVNVS